MEFDSCNEERIIQTIKFLKCFAFNYLGIKFIKVYFIFEINYFLFLFYFISILT